MRVYMKKGMDISDCSEFEPSISLSCTLLWMDFHIPYQTSQNGLFNICSWETINSLSLSQPRKDLLIFETWLQRLNSRHNGHHNHENQIKPPHCNENYLTSHPTVVGYNLLQKLDSFVHPWFSANFWKLPLD